MEKKLFFFLSLIGGLFSDVKTWDASVPGNAWNHSEHWSPSGIPGPSDTALFGTIAPIPRKEFMVTIIAPTSVGAIEFNNSNASTTYRIFGENPLKFDTLSANASVVSAAKNQSANIIDTPILLGKDLDLLNQSSARLTVRGRIDGVNKNITTYAVGDIEFSGPEHNSFSGTTTVHGGKLLFNKNPRIVAISGDLHIDSGAVEYQSERQVLPTTTISLHGSTGNATLNIGPHKETISNLILLPSSFVNKVSLEDSGKLTIQGNSLSLSDNALIEGAGTVLLAGENTGITYSGTIQNGAIQANIDLGNKRRTIATTSSGNAPYLAIDGVISNGALVKEGDGTLLLTGDNTYASGTAIHAGVLRGTTRSLQGPMQNKGEIVFDQNFHGAYASHIEGSGSLSKMGNGTVTLTGDNTFTGGILISEGTLEGTTLTLPGPILNNGALSLHQDFDGVFSGNIEGSGSIYKLGSGTILLTGENTLHGHIIVSEGTLSGTTKSLQGPLLNYASVVLAQDFNATYPSTLSGNGSFIKTGEGILDLNQKNTHQGDTLLREGTLQISHNEALGASTLKMSNETVLKLMPDVEVSNTIQLREGVSYVNVQSGHSDLLGHVSGATLIKTGPGILHFTGTGDLLGLTVDQGSLQLNGSITTANPVIIQPNTTLFGTGILNGDLDVRGNLMVEKTIAPYILPSDEHIIERFSFDTLYDEKTPVTKDLYLAGNFSSAPVDGELNISGDITFSPEATVVIKFNPNAFNTINIDGALMLDSPTLQLVPSEGIYSLHQDYKIINASSLNGQFDNVVNTFAMLSPSLSYQVEEGVSSVLFNLSVRNFSDLFQTGNSGSVAQYLDILTNNPCQNSPIVLETLINTPSGAEIEHALQQMQPSAFTSLLVAQENDLFYLRNAIYTRLQNGQSACYKKRKPKDPSQRAPLSEEWMREEIVFEPPLPPKHTIRIWGALIGGYTSQENQKGEPGFIAESPGAVLCADTSLGKHGILGGGLGYIYTIQGWKKSRGDANIQNFYATLYGQYAKRSGYVAAALSGGYSLYAANRHISFGPNRVIHAHAQSDFSGFEGSCHLKMGLNYPFNAQSISPFLGIDYMLAHLCKCEESGARSLNLKLKPHTGDLLTTEGGFEWFVCQKKETTLMKAFIRLSGIWEKRFFGETERASFVCGGSLQVKGLYPSRLLAGLGGGVSAAFGLHSTLSLSYQAKTQFQFTDQSLSIDYLWKF